PSRCRARLRWWRRSSRPRPTRCTSFRAATAAATSAPTWTSTTAPSTSTSAGNERGAETHFHEAKPLHHFRRHRRRRQIQSRAGAGRRISRPGQGGDRHPRAWRNGAGRATASAGSQRTDGRIDRGAADVRSAARPPAAGHRTCAGARRGRAVRSVHRRDFRLPGPWARIRPADPRRARTLGAGCAGASVRNAAPAAPDAVVRPATRDRRRPAGRHTGAGQVRVGICGVFPPRGRRLRQPAGRAAFALRAHRRGPAIRGRVERCGGRRAPAGLARMNSPPVWIAAQLRQLLAQRGHAWLLQGPSGLGQYVLALDLARAWLCDQPSAGGACGQCASCHAVDVRAHTDLCMLMPETVMLELGWPLGEKAQQDLDEKKRKPSKEIRVDAMRDAVEFAQRTSGRGRGKVVVVYPAERMNEVTANTLLKTLEEPAGDLRFVLASEAAHLLLPTIRSRCLGHTMAWPGQDDAAAWLQRQGVKPAEAAALLRAAGGRPDDALAFFQAGRDPKVWAVLPKALARGDAGALAGWEPAEAVSALQKLC